jgi:hypothetical protein
MIVACPNAGWLARCRTDSGRSTKGERNENCFLSGLVHVVDFVHRLIIGGFGKNLLLIIRI